MKKVLLAVLTMIFLAGTSHALTVLDFEGIPDTYWYMAGAQNLGDYYAGVTFSTDAVILESTVYGYNDYGYPPHSGDAVLRPYSSGIIRADFGIATNHVEFWYSSYSGITMEAYDASDSYIAGLIAPSNYDGVNPGSSNFLGLTVGPTEIAYVLIHDGTDYFTIDDFGWEDGNAIPEPMTVILMASGLLGLGGIARLRRKK